MPRSEAAIFAREKLLYKEVKPVNTGMLVLNSWKSGKMGNTYVAWE